MSDFNDILAKALAEQKERKADMVEVVRCKDCKYNNSCMMQNFVRDNAVTPIDDDWFCADGERRTE